MTIDSPNQPRSISSLDALGEPGRPTFGTWIKLPSLETVELIALAGFRFVVIDLEHSPLTLESAYAVTVVAQGLGMRVFVRVPDRSGTLVQRLLDSGVDGLLVPQVADADVAHGVVEQMRFPPLGSRGFGATSRAGLWGLRSRAEYLERGETDVVRCVQLESPAALEQANAILDTEGINAVFLGAADLGLSIATDPAKDARITQWTAELLSAAARRQIPCGTAVATASAAHEAVKIGFSFVLVNNDAGLFAMAAAALGKELQGFTKPRSTDDHGGVSVP